MEVTIQEDVSPTLDTLQEEITPVVEINLIKKEILSIQNKLDKNQSIHKAA